MARSGRRRGRPRKDRARDLAATILDAVDTEGIEEYNEKEFTYYLNNPDEFLTHELGVRLFDNDLSYLTREEYGIAERIANEEGVSLKYEVTPMQIARDMANLNHLADVIAGGRGSGKTYILAALCTWSLIFLPSKFNGRYEISVTAGSLEQATQLTDYMKAHFRNNPRVDKYAVKPISGRRIATKTGGVIKVLTGSEKSTRHGHPHWVIIDEMAELDKKIGSKISEAALEQLSSSPHGRVTVTSTVHYMGGKFGDIWNNAPKNGFRKVRWDALPSHLIWLPFNKQLEYWNFLKNNTSNYRVSLLGIPEEVNDREYDDEVIKKAIMDEQEYQAVMKAMTSSMVEDAWLSFDWGYHPHVTVLTLFIKVNGRVVVWSQSALDRPDTQDVIALVKQYEDIYKIKMPPIYGDSRGGQLYMNTLSDSGYHVIPVDFGKYKNGLINKAAALMKDGRLKIAPHTKVLLNALKEVVRTENGKLKEFATDDYHDSMLAGIYHLDTNKKGSIIDLSDTKYKTPTLQDIYRSVLDNVPLW